ncbi:MAG: tetraacyldisaccharide 4'-kinase [Flavobacteriaceae bacterium]|nr:tetraacyldisaccharide 4'-kinase [Flavobacteriaceae bacterium]
MKFLRNIFIVFVPFYFVGTWLRNRLYDWGLFSSKSFSVPLICVGNLNVGGTGKSPMIEFLIRLLKDDWRLATLSRGYKRTSRGFVLADENANHQSIGDEPYQFFTKFDSIDVAVDSNRIRGIECLLSKPHPPEVVLLDDAFQHRKVKAGLNILLTAYDDLYIDDMLLPTGNLREPKSGAARADIILVTKCPPDMTQDEKGVIESRLSINSYQDIFFSTISYSDLIYQQGASQPVEALKKGSFTLVTGIASAKPLVIYLKGLGLDFNHLEYPDHYNFSEKEIHHFDSMDMVLTTEKDYVRMKNYLKTDCVWYLPIEMEIDKTSDFRKAIEAFITS